MLSAHMEIHIEACSSARNSRALSMSPPGKPYSTDLRLRVVWVHIFKEMTFKEVGELLFMSSRNCVKRYVDALYTPGNVDPAHHRHGPLPTSDQFDRAANGSSISKHVLGCTATGAS